MAARISEATRAAIEADIRATTGTREGGLRRIAKRHDVSDATVRRIAGVLGISAPQAARDSAKNATETHQAWAAQKRQELSRMFLQRAEESLAAMREPAIIYNFGGKDNTYEERTVQRPPTGDQRNLMIIAATAVDKHRVIEQFGTDQQTLSAVDSWLSGMLGRAGAPGSDKPGA